MNINDNMDNGDNYTVIAMKNYAYPSEYASSYTKGIYQKREKNMIAFNDELFIMILEHSAIEYYMQEEQLDTDKKDLLHKKKKELEKQIMEELKGNI